MSACTRRRGRPCGLTPQKEKVLLNAIRLGLPYKRAAALAGISYMTFNRWRSEGEMDSAPQALRDFCDQLKAAEAELANSLIKVIFNAAQKQGNLKAAIWLLERRYPDEWGKREPINDPIADLQRMSGNY